jgi:hypothetical protein
MKCPVCGKEYSAGTLRCRKCQVLLVETAPAEMKATSIGANAAAAKQNQRAPILLWSGSDPVLFSAVTHALSESAIPFYESAVHDPSAGLFGSFPLRSDAIGGFEVRVAGCDVDAAREILDSIVGTIGTLSTTEEILEEPSARDASQSAASYSTMDFHADEATAELWNGGDEAWANYLIDVLWENGVQARAIQDASEVSRVLVRPADFESAQRVLRALEAASSPE